VRTWRSGSINDVTDGGVSGPYGDRAQIDLILGISQLTHQQREVVRLTLVAQLTPEEISRQSGTSARAVRAMLQRAVAVIRENLDFDEGEF
jgi:DNA-directed RNA polymerase specialized sigma24 family protein